jgi:hypothetical protein
MRAIDAEVTFQIDQPFLALSTTRRSSFRPILASISWSWFFVKLK